jgi:hypothetical protein
VAVCLSSRVHSANRPAGVATQPARCAGEPLYRVRAIIDRLPPQRIRVGSRPPEQPQLRTLIVTIWPPCVDAKDGDVQSDETPAFSRPLNRAWRRTSGSDGSHQPAIDDKILARNVRSSTGRQERDQKGDIFGG